MINIEVGDMHVKKDNLEESKKFIIHVGVQIEKALATGEDVRLIFLGDQFNDFGIVRVEVLSFWIWAYAYLSKFLTPDKIITIVGNHDRNSEGDVTGIEAFGRMTKIVDHAPHFIDETHVAMSFIRDNKEFTDNVMAYYEAGARTIYCHAEFQGAQFEGGFYAPHGIDPNVFPKDLKFVSGHIHKRQALGFNIFYVGTPRHLTKADIGEIKGIHIYNTKTGVREFLPTPEDVCISYKLIEIKEGDTTTYKFDDSGKTYISLIGSKEWCLKTSKKLEGNVKVSSVYTDTPADIQLKESDGISTTFNKFWESSEVPANIKGPALKLIMDTCPLLKGQ